MLDNCNLTIQSSAGAAVLVPYRPEHVAQYHAWMADPSLQELTESEPLSLQEECDMQRSWRDDPDKCTFIVLDPSLPDSAGTGSHGGAMAGDVNLYFNDHEDRGTAEIEVMVAEPASRGKRVAQEALWMVMAYAVSRLGVSGGGRGGCGRQRRHHWGMHAHQYQYYYCYYCYYYYYYYYHGIIIVSVLFLWHLLWYWYYFFAQN